METKKISQLPVVENLSESVNVLVEENGMAKRIPASNAIPSGVVKSVNGVTPDEAGNVTVDAGNNADLPYVIYTHQDDEGYYIIDKEPTISPTFAVLMEYINNARLPKIPFVHSGKEENGEGRINIEECNKISHFTRHGNYDCNAVMLGILSIFVYITDEDELLTEHEMNERYPLNEGA